MGRRLGGVAALLLALLVEVGPPAPRASGSGDAGRALRSSPVCGAGRRRGLMSGPPVLRLLLLSAPSFPLAACLGLRPRRGRGGPLCASTRAPLRSGPGAAPPAAGRRDGDISAFGDEVQAFRSEEKNPAGILGGGCTEVKPRNLMVGESAAEVQPGLGRGCGRLNCDIL